MSNKKYDYLFNLFIVGGIAVGKTAFLLRFIENSFLPPKYATIGIDFKIKLLNIQDKSIKFQICDTPGPDRLRVITKTFYKRPHSFILVYDVTNKKSFKKIKSNFIKEIEENAASNVKKILVGNKCDLPNRVVTEDEGKKLAEEYNMEFFEVSAKTGQNVNEAFNYLIEYLLKEKTGIKGIEKFLNETFNKEEEIKEDKINFNNKTKIYNLDSLKILENKYNEEINMNTLLKEENEKLKEIINNTTQNHSEEINKLKEEINKLKDDLLKANTYQKNEIKTKDNNNNENNELLTKEIFNLKNQLNNKQNEIDELKQKLKKNSIADNKISMNDIMVLNFVSSDQVIHHGIACLPNDTFAEVEEKFYKIYDDYRNANNLCTANAKPLLRFKKISENGLKDGDIIQLVKIE